MTITSTFPVTGLTSTTIMEISVTSTTISTYPACATNNILSVAPDNGSITNAYNNGFADGSGSTFDVAIAPSAYDCCVLCQLTADCQASAWSAEQNNRCVLLHNSARTCPAQSASQLFFVSNPSTTDAWTVSNGNCGYLQYAAT